VARSDEAAARELLASVNDSSESAGDDEDQ
jgi:hypothetical protein